MSRAQLSCICLIAILLSLSALRDAGAEEDNATLFRRWPSSRNNVFEDINLPVEWDVGSGRNITWSAKIRNGGWPPGFTASPVVSAGKVLIGSANVGYVERYPAKQDIACLLCFDAANGKLLWQYSSERLPTGRVHDYPGNPICSAPYVEKDRVWFVTNRCEVVCLDTDGFHDGNNDGPYASEPSNDKLEADVIWKLDMMGELGVRPHNLSNSSVTGAGDLIFLNTGNGISVDHITIPAPDAPSFLALDKNSGRVVWSDNSPGHNLLHGQWSSPAYGVLAGRPQVIFAGGDGWLYSFDPAGDVDGKAKLLWKFDCNPKTSKWDSWGRSERNNLVAMPVIYEDRVYIAGGQDGEHGEGPGHLWCIDPSKRGDVSPELVFNKSQPGRPIAHKRIQACDPEAGDFTKPNPNSAVIWHYQGLDADGDGELSTFERFHRTSSNATIKDYLLYITDIAGNAHCVDAETGQGYWTYSLSALSYQSTLIAGNRVYIGNEDGEVLIFKHAKTRELISRNQMDDCVEGILTAVNGALYIATRRTLHAIKTEPK